MATPPPNIIQEVTKASAVFFKKTIKFYTFSDLIKHTTDHHKNLYELCFQYPTRGLGFKVWRKTWPKNCYYLVHDVKMKSYNHGKIFGTLFWKGRQIKERAARIRGGTKRGLWRYDIFNSSIKLDNGLTYSSNDMMRYRPLITNNYKYGKY